MPTHNLCLFVAQRVKADPHFIRFQVARLVHSYLGETDPRNPMASPLYGDLTGLPPIRVHVGDDEVLLDDSRRYVERAVDAKLDVWMGMPHGFVANVGGFNAAAAGARCKRHVPCRAARAVGQMKASKNSRKRTDPQLGGEDAMKQTKLGGSFTFSKYFRERVQEGL